MKKFIFILLFLSVQVPIMAEKQLPYKNPTGREFPILAWYSMVSDSNLTRQRFMELRNAGFNLSFSHTYSNADLEKAFKASRGTGVKIVAMCSELETKTAETVKRYREEPTLAVWFLRDEPVATQFADLRGFRDRIYAADKNHLMYLNLLPNMVAPKDLGTASYDEYVDRFADEINLPMISYDQYPVMDDGKNIFLRGEFYGNLESARRTSLRRGCPFWAFCLSTAHVFYPIPTTEHLRIVAFSALAYGAQCIQYFTYWTPPTDSWDFHDAPIDAKGRRTEVYYRVKSVNYEIQSQARVFLGAVATEVGHTGKQIPIGTQPYKALPASFKDLTTDGEGLLVSNLKNGRSKYLMIVNRDLKHTQNVSLGIVKKVSRILKDGRSVRVKAGSTERHRLLPGDYLIYQL